jgi:Phosphatidylethanolamine-binding protein
MHNDMIEQARLPAVLLVFGATLAIPCLAPANELNCECSVPPLEVRFAIVAGHYSGVVNCGNLFLQSDIPAAPLVRWKQARSGRLYTLMMLDFDGNANGSWPDQVPVGENSPVRHWIVGNVPGDLLRSTGYLEAKGPSESKIVSVLQPYRAPHIPVVSDRYGLHLFQQEKEIQFAPLPDPITNFAYAAFLERYRLGKPEVANYFVAIYTSESPFSGKAFHGNDVSGTWHRDYGKGKLPPARE